MGRPREYSHRMIEFDRYFPDIHSAQVEMRAIRAFVKRFKKVNQLDCLFLIGVSENEGWAGDIVYERASPKGGRKKVFKCKGYVRTSKGRIPLADFYKKQPHLHCYISGYGAVTLAEATTRNINKRGRVKAYQKSCGIYYKAYVEEQCISLYTA